MSTNIDLYSDENIESLIQDYETQLENHSLQPWISQIDSICKNPGEYERYYNQFNNLLNKFDKLQEKAQEEISISPYEKDRPAFEVDGKYLVQILFQREDDKYSYGEFEFSMEDNKYFFNPSDMKGPFNSKEELFENTEPSNMMDIIIIKGNKNYPFINTVIPIVCDKYCRYASRRT